MNHLNLDYEILAPSVIKFSNKIDMLIVDGPPRITQELARYPAIPILHEYFSDRFTILLDDSKRDDEAIIIQKWKTKLFLKMLENLGHAKKTYN